MFLDWLLKTGENSTGYGTTKDVGTRQMKLASVKTKTCHIGRIYSTQLNSTCHTQVATKGKKLKSLTISPIF